MSFYIPKMPSKKLSILRDTRLLKELEVSKDDIQDLYRKYIINICKKGSAFMKKMFYGAVQQVG